MAVLFCALWVGQIRDFKKLNNAKFSVLNEMAPHLTFAEKESDSLISYQPFQKEWTKLGELNALEELGKSNIVALKSSNIEYFIPKAFAVLFCGMFLILILIILFNWPLTKLVQSTRGSGNEPMLEQSK